MPEAHTEASRPNSEAAPLTANVQIVSPNIGIGPLSFTTLPLDTTVRQLKEKIRDALPSHPTDDQQRLIHRGRLLARESDTLRDIFTEDVLRTGDQQTLHLVLRDFADRPPPAPPSQTTPLRGQSPAPANYQAPHVTQGYYVHQRPIGPRGTAPGFPGAVAPLPVHGQPTAQAMLQHQQQHQNILQQQQQSILQQQLLMQQQQQQQQQPPQSMQQWANHLQVEQFQREMLNRQLLAQQHLTNGGRGNAVDPAGRNSPGLHAPGPTQTVVREGFGPNGQYWRMTVNETITTASGSGAHLGPGSTSSPVGRGPLSPADVANIMRGADATQATQAMTDAMHRSTSGASLAGVANLANANAPIQPIQPGVTTPLFPGTPRHTSRTATPDPSVRLASNGGNPAASAPSGQVNPQPALSQPEVYILSSPNGPRGLLINGSSELYVTPAAVRQPTGLQYSPYYQHPVRYQPATGLHPWPVQPQPRPQRQGQPQAQAQPQQQFQQQNVQGPHPVPVRPFQGHPNNPGAVALVAAAWPHIWLIIRLVVFVWWFTSNDPSWSRWATMVAIAIVVFVLNTGMLNGLVNQAWDPFRQHLEGLIPLAHPNRPQREAQPAAPARPAANGDGREGAAISASHGPTEPNPAQTATRLVAGRRNANANWLLDQVRRLERAGILFLASIAPGVAERHIAHIEEQERAERRRREAEEAAAAAAAAASEQENGTTEGEALEGEDANDGEVAEPPAAEQPPLIQI